MASVNNNQKNEDFVDIQNLNSVDKNFNPSTNLKIDNQEEKGLDETHVNKILNKKFKGEPLRILYASFEAVPFVKLGGLGDVAGTLPMSIHAHNCDIRVILPYHSIIGKELTTRIKKETSCTVDFMDKKIEFELHSIKLRGVVFYLVKNKHYFDRPQAYGEKDDLERFVFFSRAILASITNMKGFIPQIIHCNDWHTAMTPVYLHEDFKDKLDKYNIKTCFTIHNLLYQGKYKYEKVSDILGLKNQAAIDKVMYKGKVNVIKAGISCSDCVTTPSPNYAKEITTFAYGEGLEDVMKSKEDVTFGILNGIDYVDFNPAWDTNIKVHFTKDLIERRLGDKIDLQNSFHLKVDPQMLLCVVACRFYEQKGISLIIKAVPKIVENGGQILFLGDGDEKYKDQIREYQKQYPGKVSSHLEFDPYLPHNLYAGADVLLMPSKFEPCGVAQMMAMHYGALPLVRSTGGLKDTVHNYEPKSLVCNGFVFQKYEQKDFEDALDVVFYVWKNDRKNWRRMQRRAMDKDFSWKESGRKYCVLYHALIEDKLETVNDSFDNYAIAHATKRAQDAAKKAARHAQDRAQMAQKELARAGVEGKQSFTSINSFEEFKSKFPLDKDTKSTKPQKQSNQTIKENIEVIKTEVKDNLITSKKLKRLEMKQARIAKQIEIERARLQFKQAKLQAKEKIKLARQKKN